MSISTDTLFGILPALMFFALIGDKKKHPSFLWWGQLVVAFVVDLLTTNVTVVVSVLSISTLVGLVIFSLKHEVGDLIKPEDVDEI